MKLVKQNIESKDQTGSVTLIPEEPEDMWHIYNLIQNKDIVRASTVRRVVKETSDGSNQSSRVLTKLTIRVTSTDFDSGSSHLRVSGQIAEANDFAGLGSFHTLDLELSRQFALEKPSWDAIAIETLRTALDATSRASLWAVLMREGYANICLVTEFQTVIRQRVEVPLPKKRGGGRDGGYDSAMLRFHRTLLQTLLRHLDLTTEPRPPLLIASPGFAAQNFLAYIKTAAASAPASASSATDPNSDAIPVSGKVLNSYIPSIHLAHSNNASPSSIPSLISSPALKKALDTTRSAGDAAALDKLHKHLRDDDNRAWYGAVPIFKAFAQGVIAHGSVLLVSDRLFRASEVAERKRWVVLVEGCREQGAECRVVSSAHEVGRRLEALGGVAAILAWGVDGLDQEEEDME
ncbi:hypothetical protein P152DRAFT_478799 [Eremomyces bilateralis CBS 781.70]|uniref:Protein DOM34 homolog n=1 Tax=Eremomyces bilateralis CBS 781.70 TaxID=1392243 RepID=A0A6G1GDV0_9PEZI|nr:uncharacterized protein P152DRAFT_478799 [Eremomyces bilateralis CBS 781.70]KAF1816228.1 hypothetical protein P152DRAFT_478799 [Eremomyces bilateralis CBS 781.70]